MRKNAYWIVMGFLFVLGVVLYLIPKEKQETESPVESAPSLLEDADRAVRERYGEDCERVSQSVVTPYTYTDGKGDTLTYSLYRTFYPNGEVPEMVGLSPVLNDILDPATAEDRRPCRVGTCEAMLYQKEGRGYLCWTVNAEYSMAIEYNLENVTEGDIFRMAESVPVDAIS